MKAIQKIKLKESRVLTDAEMKNIAGGENNQTGFITCAREDFIQDTCKSGFCLKGTAPDGSDQTGYCSKKTDIHTEYGTGNIYILICECS